MKFLLILYILLSSMTSRTITQVQQVQVDAQVGTVPTLPYQLWVTYSDGTQEWRQVKWMNYSRATEEMQSNPELYPVGKTYTVNGFVLGDNTTRNGYPVTATVRVAAQGEVLPVTAEAHTLPLADVRITGNNRLTHNRDRDIEWLLSLDISQQLYNYRDTYGLSTDGYTESDGWDSPTTKLKGHGTGHFLSALAFAYASAQDGGVREQLRQRIRTMVDQLRECQERTFVYDEKLGRYREARDYAPEEELREMQGSWEDFDRYKKDYAHYGYGYLNAIPAAHPALIEMYRPYNNSQWVWAPYYSIHKQLAGLIDIVNNVDDKAISTKAFRIAHDMGLWVWNRLHYRTFVQREGTKEERQARPGNRYEMWNMYIAGEVGGMSESLARLSEMTADAEEKARLLEASNYFDSPAFFDPVSVNVDDIRTRHANQHIPMITGALKSYAGNHDPYYYRLASNFWNLIQGRYAYAMGGVGNGEMFRQPYSQMISMNTNIESDADHHMHPNPNINETCCAYNLAKLTKDLNAYRPDDARYMDYYERVLYNQLVGSLHPEHWGTTYQYAVGLNAQKDFDNDTPQSSCCGGTGVENHVKYQEAAYFVNDHTLWVGLYLPTVAYWREKDITLTQECEWPSDYSRITVSGGTFSLKLRVPYWATAGFSVRLNGQEVQSSYQPCSYVEIPLRTWKPTDVVEVSMPFTAHVHYGADKMDIAATGQDQTRTSFEPAWLGALMYGPLVMASTEITDWNQAEFPMDAALDGVQLHGATAGQGPDGHLYTLSLNGVQFQPDYCQTEHSTHYLRLLSEKAVAQDNGVVDRQELDMYMQLARERIETQEQWLAMPVRIPSYAPWAPHGYARMVELLKQAEASATGQQVGKLASALNVIINSMRPGNLAEPEDLQELLSLSSSLKNISDKSQELRSALDYADTVIQYVNDGSGTPDMIEKAIERLKNASR